MNLRKSKLRHTAEVSTHSLNDIMFFLLLFFLIVSTLVNPSVIKLTLPSATKSQQMNKQQITIDVDAEMNFYLNNKAVAYEELETKLAQKVESVQQATVVLRLDNSLTIQQLVDVLEIGNRLNVKMILATRAPNA